MPLSVPPSAAVRRLTGWLLVLVPSGFLLGFTLLQQLFDYPAILRQSTAAILTQFAAGGPALGAVWYLLVLSALAFVGVAVLFPLVIAPAASPAFLAVTVVVGALAGLVQALGFLRWTFLVPHLAAAYLDPAATAAQQVTAGLLFDAFHSYLGMGVGEHLGYLGTSLWTALIAVLLLRAGGVARWFGVAGLALALGVAAGLAEPWGWSAGAAVNALGYVLWAIWLVALGVRVLRAPAAGAVAAPAVPAAGRPLSA